MAEEASMLTKAPASLPIWRRRIQPRLLRPQRRPLSPRPSRPRPEPAAPRRRATKPLRFHKSVFCKHGFSVHRPGGAVLLHLRGPKKPHLHTYLSMMIPPKTLIDGFFAFHFSPGYSLPAYFPACLHPPFFFKKVPLAFSCDHVFLVFAIASIPHSAARTQGTGLGFAFPKWVCHLADGTPRKRGMDGWRRVSSGVVEKPS